jgi:hypothetical protein
MRDGMKDGFAHRVALVLWPSFVVGGIGTVCFFSLFDPATLPFSDALLPFDEGRLGQSRLLVYSVGFLVFWMSAAASSWLTSFLQRPPSDINAAPPGATPAAQAARPDERHPDRSVAAGSASALDDGARAQRQRPLDSAADSAQTLESHAGQPGIAQPLEMLLAGHDRIEARFDALRGLPAHVRVNGCDERARQVAADVIRYFDTAARHHRDDEELELFPRLLERSSGEKGERAAMLVAWLTAEHREIDSAWEVQRSLLGRIVRGETVDLSDGEIDRFAAFYRGHTAVEEQQLLPLAAALLAPAEVAAIAAAMARRRAVAPIE